LEAVFILLEFPSPSRRIFIGSHSLPPLWFAVSVLQIRPLTADEKSEKRKKKEEEWKALTEGSRDRSRDEAARKAHADRKGKRIVGG
jgi:hypothetical protein